MKSYSACLFWFDNEYTKIQNIIGKNEFTEFDIQSKKTVEPIGEHFEYVPNPNITPRGRISLIDGEIRLNVGTKCSQEGIDLAIKVLGFQEVKNFIKVNAGYHWDKK
jgi:hypothetical protein